MNKFCGQCGSRLDPYTDLCPNCDKQKRHGPNKGIVAVITILTVVAIVCITYAALYPKGYFINAHLFQAHTWQGATCEDPAVCKYCGETKSDAPGHRAGAPVVTEDIVHAETQTLQLCENCGETLEKSRQPILSFLGDSKFDLTPDQFVERYISILKEASPDSGKIGYTAESAVYNSNTTDEKLMYQITYSGDVIAYLYCYDQANEMIRFADKDTAHIWCVVLRAPLEEENSISIALCIYDSLMAACDPTFSTDEREQYVNCWTSWVADNPLKDGSLLFQAKSNILYREEVVSQNDGNFFYFTAYSTMNLGSLDEGAVDYEQEPPAEDPNYADIEADAYITGTWTAQYILLEEGEEAYEYSLEQDDHITLSFQKDHRAELNIQKFYLDEKNDLGIADFWNESPMQWYYMYDSGTTLYFLLHSPYMVTSIPCQYETGSKFEDTIKFAISESVYLVFKKNLK